MKKLLLFAAIAIVTMVAGCSNSSKSGDNGKDVTPKTTADSISMYLGTAYGAQMAEMVDSTVNKEEFISGMKTAFNTPYDSLQSVGMALMDKAQKASGKEKSQFESQLGGMGVVAQYMIPAIEGMKQQFKIDLNKDILLHYFKAAFTADKPVDLKPVEAEMNKIMQRLMPQAAQQGPAVDTEKADANAKAGADYIEKQMKADKSLKKTASGLVYKVIKEGKGAKPTAEQTAQVKYEGRHINGEVFDNGQGQVQEFPVSRVVPGFSEGLMLMSPGAKYRFYIPGNLGYGEQGTPGGPIGPNETLVFDVELVGVK